MQLIRGTLAMSVKKVSDHLTPIDKVFALEQDTVLDAQQLGRLRQYGHSRIPVYQGTLDDVVGVLLVKSLVGVADPTQPARVRDFKLQPIITLSSTYGLYDALHHFQTGRSHLAIVKEENADGDSRTVGIITMEDILEELFLAEIQDETDLDKLRRSSTRFSAITREDGARANKITGRTRARACVEWAGQATTVSLTLDTGDLQKSNSSSALAPSPSNARTSTLLRPAAVVGFRRSISLGTSEQLL